MPGPKPIPTALKVLRGNPGQRRLPEGEPQLPVAAASAAPPEELAGDPIALAEWQRLEPLLRGARVLTEGDRAALLALCQQWSQYRGAQARVLAEGRLVKAGPRSTALVQNPHLPIANKALLLCLRLWTDLGLTPAARTRVTAARESSADELDAFLQ